MDPNATLKALADAIQDDSLPDAFEAISALKDWLVKGGFDPDWPAYPDAADYYNEVIGE